MPRIIHLSLSVTNFRGFSVELTLFSRVMVLQTYYKRRSCYLPWSVLFPPFFRLFFNTNSNNLKEMKQKLHADDVKINGFKVKFCIKPISGSHLEFHRILWEVLVGHEGRMLAAPLEQRGEPGLVLWPALVHLLMMKERGGGDGGG